MSNKQKKLKRLEWLEKQIEIQQNALVNCYDVYMSRVHAYLLQKVTDEWCELMKEVG